MIGSKHVSGLGKSVLCETLETRSMFSASTPLDPFFAGGLVKTSFGGTDEVAYDAIALKDGRTLATGESTKAGKENTVFAMYKANGSLDTSFNGTGKLSLPVSTFLPGSGGAVVATKMYQQPSGAILLVTDYGLFRLKLNGTLDTSFGVNGRINEPNDKVVMNVNGSFRTYTPTANQGAFGTHTYDVNGKLLTTGPQNVAGVAHVLTDGTVIAVGEHDQFTFYTAALKKITTLGIYGDTYLQSQFDQLIKDGKPWKDPHGNPISSNWVFAGIDGIATTRDGGYLIFGRIGGTQAGYPSEQSGGISDTPFTAKLNAKGNFVSLTTAATDDGRTTADFTWNFGFFNGNIAYGLGSDITIGSPILPGGVISAEEASDTTYYLAGFTNSSTGHEEFAIAHTEQTSTSVDPQVIKVATLNSQYGTVASGRVVFIDSNGNGKLDAGELSAITDQDGEASFKNLGAGSYAVRMVLSTGETVSYGQPVVTLTAGQNAGFFIDVVSPVSPPTGTISGILFSDDNFDQKLDNGEKIVPGRVVYIDANHNGKLDAGEKSTTTDSTGRYTFTGLAAASYDIKRVLPSSDYRITTSTTPVNLATNQTLTFNIGSTSKPAATVKDLVFA